MIYCDHDTSGTPETTCHRNSAATCLREAQLAARWQVSRRTLQRWRQHTSGPAWLQINGVVLYREADILAFEERNRAG